MASEFGRSRSAVDSAHRFARHASSHSARSGAHGSTGSRCSKRAGSRSALDSRSVPQSRLGAECAGDSCEGAFGDDAHARSRMADGSAVKLRIRNRCMVVQHDEDLLRWDGRDRILAVRLTYQASAARVECSEGLVCQLSEVGKAGMPRSESKPSDVEGHPHEEARERRDRADAKIREGAVSRRARRGLRLNQALRHFPASARLKRRRSGANPGEVEHVDPPPVAVLDFRWVTFCCSLSLCLCKTRRLSRGTLRNFVRTQIPDEADSAPPCGCPT